MEPGEDVLLHIAFAVAMDKLRRSDEVATTVMMVCVAVLTLVRNLVFLEWSSLTRLFQPLFAVVFI